MARELQVKVTGVREIQRQIRKVAREIGPAAMAIGIYAAGNEIMRTSKRRVPVDLGVLRASGYVTLPDDIFNPEVEMGYGGPAVAYAVRQHETHRSQKKFLESAVNFWSGFIPKLIQRTGRDAIDSGRVKRVRKAAGMPRNPWGG